MKNISNTFLRFLPIGATIISLAILIYASSQQIYRQSLNDPQVQLVRDMESALIAGITPTQIVGRNAPFDATKSLSTFIAIYDKDGNPLESSATIGSSTPKPPLGVFAYAKVYGENHVTWQPNSTTRIALVLRPVANTSGYFVVSGRNMIEVEKRINDLGHMVTLLTLLILLGIFSLYYLEDYLGNIRKSKDTA